MTEPLLPSADLENPAYLFKPAIGSLQEALEYLALEPNLPWEQVEAQRQHLIRRLRPANWAELDDYQRETLTMQARHVNMAYEFLSEQQLRGPISA